MKKVLTLMFVMLLALVLVGCGGGGSATIQLISIKGDSSIKVGETKQYQAEFTPADYPDQSVTWSTSDESALTIDQNGKAKGVAETESSVFIYAKSNADANAQGRKKVVVKSENQNQEQGEYPNLEGYTIRIAQAAHELRAYDPFLDEYKQPDKEAKKQAWREVEELFNCKIEVAAYPSSADWGPARWNYILQQAQFGVSDFDFLTVPDSQIPTFVEGGALIALDEFYTLYGKNMMDPSFVVSGKYKNKLYSFTFSENSIYNVMYYNIGLLEQLQEVDPTLKEPAQIFNEKNWDHSTFLDYCKQVQDAMAVKFGAAGVAGADTQEYYAISGWDSYWWIGLATNDGEPLANIDTMTIDFSGEHKKAAAELVREIYKSGYADPKQNVDGSVVSWKEEKALFNTGDLWFVNDANRWPSDMWGENTRYGYVPWPRAEGVYFDDIKVALGGTATWVMPIGRDYSQFGDECTAKNIYWAVAEMLQRADKYYKEDATYDEEIALDNAAAKVTHSEESKKAYIYIQKLIKAGKGYYDPLSNPDNPVGSLYTNNSNRTTIKGAVTQFCTVRSVETWEEAIAPLVPLLQESLRKAFS